MFTGKIKLNIDWLHLFSKPFQAVVSDVFVLVAPANKRKYDANIRNEIDASVKAALLAQLNSNSDDLKSE